MTIYLGGALNAAALVVPDVAVVLLPPDAALINGQPTNVLGIVGSASWGPVNAPVIIGSYAHYAATFGHLKNRAFDMGTPLAAAALQGANNFRCVRVVDGTELAATVVVQTNCITFTSKYTGSLANSDKVTLSAGSQAGTWAVTVVRPGQAPEFFDNIGLGLSGNALWAAIAAAVNTGVSSLRGPSQYVVATAGAGTTAPAAATHSLAGGADGAANVSESTVLGANASPRTGMYALAGAGCAVAMLADATSGTSWAAQAAFGLSEGCYMILSGPSGETIASAATNRASAGIDTPWAKILVGDFCLWNDVVNGVQRYISPQGFVAGQLVNLAPQFSGLNRPVQGILATQRTINNLAYSAAELQAIGVACLDVIARPSVGGAYFSPRFGRNASSNAVIHGDNYPRVTALIARSLNAGLGVYVGQLQSPDVRREAAATISAFLDTLWSQGVIGNAQDTIPYSVQIDDGNNPRERVALGYMQADVRVQYLSVIEFFVLNLQAGQAVTIATTGPQPVLN